MLLKIGAIAALIICGLVTRHAGDAPGAVPHASLGDFGAALVPVLFAYGGWQTANFVAAEMREPRRDLPRALLLGVAGVITLYLLVNFVCVRVLGPDTLARTATPASAIMRVAFGKPGATFIAAAIAISTLGFLAQSILTAPRVYYAMANDGLFFPAVAWISPRTHVPIVAILLQSVWTMVIALTGRYEQILNYVVAMDFIFFGLTAATIFVFRRRSEMAPRSNGFRVPGHPFTTILFIAACWLVVGNTVWRYPANTLIGITILLAGIPVFLFWQWRRHA